MDTEKTIHATIDEKWSDIQSLQRTLAILGLPEYWPVGYSQLKASVLPPEEDMSGPTESVKDAVLAKIRSARRPMDVDALEPILRKTVLRHEQDERIRRRKISQGLYANKDVLKAAGGEGGRKGYAYGLREWFDGEKLRKEYQGK